MDILYKNTNLPTTIISDMGTQFNCQVTKVAAVLNIELKHATTKHAQTIGMLERTHASVKARLKAATGEFNNNWHKFLPLAVLNHNTMYHATLGCEPTRVIHGRILHNILVFKLGYNPNPRYQPQTEIAEEVQRRIALLHDQTKNTIMQSCVKYKAHYDRKAKAAPLTTQDYCLILNPKADTHATRIPFREFRWVGPHKIEKVLPNNNYIVRRLGTNKTKLLQRIRLGIYIPHAPLASKIETDWQKEATLIAQDDLYAHTWDTNFGSSPFDTEHETNDHQENIVVYEPTSQPEMYRPLSSVNSQKIGGPQQNNLLWMMKSPKYSGKSLQKMKIMRPYQKGNPENSHEIPSQNSPETPENNPEIDAQETEETVNTRSEKYNLRPNPSPNYSDSYRYWKGNTRDSETLFKYYNLNFRRFFNFRFYFFLQPKDWKILSFVFDTEEETKWGNISQKKVDLQICKQE